MKLLLILLTITFSTAHAETFRCKDNGKTSFQDTPCSTGGSTFDYGEDISLEKQQAAQSQLKRDMNAFNAKKQRQYEANQKERAIRAEEDKADAGFSNARANRAQAYQQRRTANAIRTRNDIEATRVRY